VKINVSGVHKVYGRGRTTKVLDDVHLVVEQGGFIAIMGPSGSGKTTLMNLIGCLDTPTFGSVFLETTDVARADESRREQIRLHHVGFIFQHYNLLPTLTVMENVVLPMQLAGVRRSERQGRGKSLLKLVGLESQAQQKTNTLSGGEQQKVAIARSLANLPGLLLADEPTGNLDVKSTQQVMDVIRSINQDQHITTVLVTHDPHVARYAHEIYHLDNGRLQRGEAP